MKKITILFLLLHSIGFAQQTSWEKVSAQNLTPLKQVERSNFPKDFKLFATEISTLKSALQTAPNRLTSSQSNTVVTIPNVNGGVERFQMFEFSNFAPELQAQFPNIRSYIGVGVDDKKAQIRLSIDDSGMQAMIFRTDKRNEFIEPYSTDGSVYAVYESSREKGALPFTCSTVDSSVAHSLQRQQNVQTPMSSSGELLLFRLALSCNAEYTTYFGGTVAGALAAMNATMTRVNGVFEKDLSIHMNIIANNNLVIFTNASTDPYTTMGNWNGQLQTTLSNIIGEDNYDIGHMFGSTGGGGNAGCIGCVCEDGSKGSGITSPSNGVPMGDTFDIDYVAHEMGHQFGGNHTFSHNVEGSGVNVEPGSGSTIMGYAGITTRDVQPNSDDYFVYASIKQIQDNMFGKTCPTRVTLSNITPLVNAGLDYTIPKSTPFVLTGTASDGNGDALTYCWEQNDTATTQTGAASAASATKTGGPNWRSYDPVSSPQRYFPTLARVVANQSTTQGTDIVVEALSSVARTLNFVLTVRDNFAGSGQTNSDDMTVTVDAVAGPFLVSTPNTAVSWAVGSNQTVTWDVAGTTANGVNAQYVDVFLSTDGGFTYPIQLASKVPNDGSEVITVPNNVGTTNRIMVKGYKHIFYDISNANFSIVAPAVDFAIAYNGVAEQQNKQICTGSSVSYTIPYTAFGGFNGTVNLALSGQPAGTTGTFSPGTVSANGNVILTINNTGAATPGFYAMTVTATSGSITKTAPFYLELFNANFPTQTLTYPAHLQTGIPTTLTLTWPANANATAYDVQVATDDNFTNIVASATVTTNSYDVTGLADATNYVWRVLPKNNACVGNYSTANLFKTGLPDCTVFTSTNVPITIPTTANVTVNSTLNVASTNTISDVNVTVNISHTWVNDMTITLISPTGTQVQLVAQPCVSDSLLNINATFDDSGTALVCQTNPAISGTIQPFQSLSAFNGQNMNGTWTLRVLDSFNQDGGTINSWSLRLCSTTAVPLSVEESSISAFSLYPNPNNGDFNIQFNSTSNEPIELAIFDIRGRQIYQNVYTNNGFFNENLQLANLQSGVYLVKVKDGKNELTKKFIKQ
ncbi:zinc-dependent metalloprotease family protein [Flavobacterium cheonhonense]|uniref:Zinc-dependent metalloprotease family protein n=1 Tax=Flavobacterium cheonhonense TaxID=706185 RepID=A0ABP7TX41_9FLAO|nr:zinc-dependent metalloprotease family protein [Flavobacterium cheonhonense]